MQQALRRAAGQHGAHRLRVDRLAAEQHVPQRREDIRHVLRQAIVSLADELNGDRKEEDAGTAGKATLSRWLNIWPGKARAASGK